MHKTFVLILACLLFVVPAHAGDEPTIQELAKMVLHGNDAEHAMVAKWLEKADRGRLLALFKAVRALRAQPAGTHVPDSEDDAPQPLINMEVRFIDVPVDKVDLLLGPDRPTADATSRLMNPDEARRLLVNIEATPGAKVVSAPRLTTYDKQKANVQVVNQISFIQDYDVETGNRTVVDPIIGVMQEGVTLELRGEVARDRKSVAVEFLGTWAVVQRPIKEQKITLAGKELTIQLPELDVAKTEASIRLRDGGHALIGGGVQFEIEGTRVERVALLHVKVIEMDKGELRELEQELEAEAHKARAAADPELSKPMFELQTDVIFVPTGKLEAFLGKWAEHRKTVHWLDADRAKVFLSHAEADADIQIVGSAPLTTLLGKKTDLEQINRVSYVKEYEEVEKGGKTFISPVVDTISEGVVLEMTPHRATDPRFAVIEFVGSYAALDRPIPTLERTYKGRKLVVQVPELRVQRARHTIKMEDGGYVLVRGVVPEGAKGEHMTLIRLKIGTVGEFIGAAPVRIRKK